MKANIIERIQTALQITIQKIQPEMIESMHKLGITPTQLFVMNFIKKKGSCRITQLADKMSVKPSAVTFMIDRLEQSEFVAREHDKKDRRAVNITLTCNGEEKLSETFAARKAIVERHLSSLTEDELTSLADIAEKLAQ